MEKLMNVVDEVLTRLAKAKHADPEGAPRDLVIDSLDQMRLLVMLEETLDVVFDDAELKPFDLTSRTTLVESVAAMLIATETSV
ncbi:Phosphopantetheine attachment site [Pseudomonas sp. NFACC02]|uniref:phosphopantetheine-binding protein n=1 Tax=Pseudomonas sp. NFACC02 TaxID=1566250 RepID=UPI0008C10330|nr:phosphopantetheine-binding protein [Pseudomonas sp. NFACC02]SEQ54477.1 Phosphopantetheine attachment site [Pseudomonas sp. NFACC02]